jgi:hypothetical protein
MPRFFGCHQGFQCLRNKIFKYKIVAYTLLSISSVAMSAFLQALYIFTATDDTSYDLQWRAGIFMTYVELLYSLQDRNCFPTIVCQS